MSDISDDIVNCQEGEHKEKSYMTSHPVTGKGYHMCPWTGLSLGICEYSIERNYKGQMGKTELTYECLIKGHDEDGQKT